MRRYAVSLSYVGTRFRGWARQPNGIPSVCEAVDDALDALVKCMNGTSCTQLDPTRRRVS